MAYMLDERDKSILEAIIQEYIATGEPVGSRIVSRKYVQNISPATVRNVMADLEEMAFLYQPHVSAGRIPTPEGFRCFLDEIMEFKALPRGDRTMIARHLAKPVLSLKETIKQASHLLSQISRNAAIVIMPKLGTFFLKHIDFVRLDAKRILVILVSRSGVVYNQIVHDEDIFQDDLVSYSNYLNTYYADLTIQEMRDALLQEISSEKARFDRIVSQAIGLGMVALDCFEDTPDIVIEGKESIFNSPDLADLDKFREILNTFEDKGRIVRILNMVLEIPGVRVLLGEEMGYLGMQDFSMVASGYYRGDIPLGSLGVIGPIRMDYSRVIPLVGYMANYLSNMLEDL